MFYCSSCGATLKPSLTICGQCGYVFPHPVPESVPESEYRAHYWPPKQSTSSEEFLNRARNWWEGISNKHKALAGGALALLLIVCIVPRPGQGNAEQRSGEPQPYRSPTYVPPPQPPVDAAPPVYVSPPVDAPVSQAPVAPVAPTVVNADSIRAQANQILTGCVQNGIASEQGTVDKIDCFDEAGYNSIPQSIGNVHIGEVWQGTADDNWGVGGNCVVSDMNGYARQRNIGMTFDPNGHCTYLGLTPPDFGT